MTSFLRRLLKPAPEAVEAARVLETVARAARRPDLFAHGRFPDSLEGRLAALFLHAGLALIRLRAEPAARGVAQAFADQLFRHVDEGLRESGVGDLSVPKTMKRLAGQFYGRLQVYAAAIDAGDEAALADALSRNAMREGGAAFAPALAVHVFAIHAALAGAPVAQLADSALWLPPPASAAR